MQHRERINAELAHLVRCAETSLGMYEFAVWKAQKLALEEPVEFNGLPVLLSNALASKRFGPPRPSTKPRSEACTTSVAPPTRRPVTR